MKITGYRLLLSFITLGIVIITTSNIGVSQVAFPELKKDKNAILRSPQTDTSLVNMMWDVKVKIPFVDWGAWSFDTTYGDVYNGGVIKKYHPWDSTCYGYQVVRRGIPLEVYMTCRSYCFYGTVTAHYGHPLFIYSLRKTCQEFKIMDVVYNSSQ